MNNDWKPEKNISSPMIDPEITFNAWFNDDTYGHCEVEDVKTRKDLLYKWIHAAYCAGYEENYK
jgi:hypothetical protein